MWSGASTFSTWLFIWLNQFASSKKQSFRPQRTQSWFNFSVRSKRVSRCRTACEYLNYDIIYFSSDKNAHFSAFVVENEMARCSRLVDFQKESNYVSGLAVGSPQWSMIQSDIKRILISISKFHHRHSDVPYVLKSMQTPFTSSLQKTLTSCENRLERL